MSRDRLTLAIAEMKASIYSEQSGRCATCGLPMPFAQFELAHLAPQRAWLVERYGEAVIHHRRNMVGTHAGLCNAAAQLDPESAECTRHLESIREEVGRAVQG